MSDLLKTWMVGAESFEMQKLYGVKEIPTYDFTVRQGDFYITLLNRMYSILTEIRDAQYDTMAKELIDVVQSMLVYSEKASEDSFDGVNKFANHLYVATIFFLTRYEAVAMYLLHDYKIDDFVTESAQIIYYVITGGKSDINNIESAYVKGIVTNLKEYILYGNDGLNTVKANIEAKFDAFTFKSLDDFFDTALLVHVLRKFSKNNIRATLISRAMNVDWEDYIRFSFDQNIFSFLPSQEDAINKGLLDFDKAFSLKMPTSAGKSYITELVIYQELRKNANAKILYLAPLRSLCRELKYRFEQVGKDLNFSTRAIYGGSVYPDVQNVIEEVQLLISTPESFKGMENTLDEELSKFSLIICDEGQLIENMNRGVDYELLLTRLKKLENVRFLFLSAIIPNIKDINTWLGGSEIEVGDSNYRPCPIKFAYVSSGYNLIFKDENYSSDKFIITNFLQGEELNGVGTSKRAKASALALKSLNSGTVMIFTTRKGGKTGCEAIGYEIAKILDKEKFPSPAMKSRNPEELDVIADYISFQFGEEHSLPHFVRKGFAYHHGHLPQDIREILEHSYAKEIIPLMICTNTLTEGVNFPIRTLVLYDLTRFEKESQTPYYTIGVKEIKNIVGRVGRAGKQRFGVVIYPDDDKSRQTYKNVIYALRNEHIHNFMGFLYRLIKAFGPDINAYDENSINDVLVRDGLVNAIDTMIVRSVRAETFDDINIDDVVNESLAYNIGNENERNTLTRVFRIRYLALSEKLNADNYSLFRNTGMPVDDMAKMEELITYDILSSVDIDEPLSDSWLDFAIDTIMQMPSFKKCEIKRDAGTSVINSGELKTLLINWINGKQYFEISEVLNCDVNEAIDLVISLQGGFRIVASSIVRYIETLDFNIDMLGDWIDMINYGVNTREKLLLIKSGLGNRILVNSLLDDGRMRSSSFNNSSEIHSFMQRHKDEIISIAKEKSLPEICIRCLTNYLL